MVLLFASKAPASTDINGLYDARSHGMGGTGVAFIDSAGAIPMNPALLDQIDKLTATLDVFGIAAQPTAPYTIWHQDEDGQRYTTYETVTSKTTFAPLPFIGAAYRLHERIVLGLGAYPVIGQGTRAKYRPAPDELPNVVATNNASMGLVEIGDALSIRLLDNLSLGLMWRITYMTQKVSTPVPTGGAPAGVLLNADRTAVANADVDITGLNFKGFEVGLLYKVLPNLRLGFSYRSKVAVWGKGTTTTHLGATEIKLPTEGGFTNPHAFRGGFALSFLDEKLLFAADFKYLLYAEAYKEIKTVTIQNGEKMASYTPAYWKNSSVFEIGAESKVSKRVALRAGYTGLSSATNAAYAKAFMAPPGWSHLVTAGLGVKVLDSLNIDAAAGYVVLQSHVDTATEDNAGVGTYASRGGEVSLSTTYHR